MSGGHLGGYQHRNFRWCKTKANGFVVVTIFGFVVCGFKTELRGNH